MWWSLSIAFIGKSLKPRTLHLSTPKNCTEAFHKYSSSLHYSLISGNIHPWIEPFSIPKSCLPPSCRYLPDHSCFSPWRTRYHTAQPLLQILRINHSQIMGKQWTSDPRFKAIAGTKPWASGTVGWYQVRQLTIPSMSWIMQSGFKLTNTYHYQGSGFLLLTGIYFHLI